MNEEHITEVWNTLKEYIPAKDKQEAANQYITLLSDDLNVSQHVLNEMQDVDEHLDVAISSLEDEDMDIDNLDTED